jgi:hypothetical protein
VGQMLPEQLIAMLNSVGPARGADTLLAMPADQIQMLISVMRPAQIARLVDGARAERKPELLAAIGPTRWPMVLGQLSVHQVVDLVSSLPLPVAVTFLRSMSPAATAGLLMEFPTQRQVMLQEALGAQQPPEATSTDYRRQAENSVARIATRMSRLDNGSGDLVAEVMGRPFHIAVRHHTDAALTGEDLRLVAGRVDWRLVAGMLLMTNAVPADTVGAVVRELRNYGHAVDVVRWSDDSDDGTLKRALVRLLS